VDVYVLLEELLLEDCWNPAQVTITDGQSGKLTAMLLVSSALPPWPLALVAALLVLSLFLKLPAELLPLE
jgi:hypothetical protein